MASRKLLTTILIVGLAFLAFVNYSKRVQLAKELAAVRLNQTGNEDATKEAERAKEIIAKVRRHIMLTGDVEPTVAQVVDAAALKEKNSFYQNAENGDYLIITPLRAVLYSEEKNILLDVVPVQLTPPPASSTAAQ